MKKILGVVGVAAACGVCCAFPLALPLLGGLAASGMGFALGWEAVAVAAVATVVALVLFVHRRQANAATCSPVAPKSAECGCGSSCAAGKGSAS